MGGETRRGGSRARREWTEHSLRQESWGRSECTVLGWVQGWGLSCWRIGRAAIRSGGKIEDSCVWGVKYSALRVCGVKKYIT